MANNFYYLQTDSFQTRKLSIFEVFSRSLFKDLKHQNSRSNIAIYEQIHFKISKCIFFEDDDLEILVKILMKC